MFLCFCVPAITPQDDDLKDPYYSSDDEDDEDEPYIHTIKLASRP